MKFFTTYQPNIKSIGGNIRIRSIHQAKNGTFFTGTNENGLFEFDPESGDFKRLSNPGIPLPQIKKIIDYDTDQLLIAYGRGLATYNYKTKKLQGLSARSRCGCL